MGKRLFQYVFVGFSIFNLLFSSVSAAAIDVLFYSSNNILYYNPGDICGPQTAIPVNAGSVGQYTNPVYKDSAPDPAVVTGTNGMFYVYATGGVLLESKDMSTWKRIDGNWKLKGAPGDAGGAKWAPDVVKAGSKYILTYTIPTGTPEYPGGGDPKIAYAVGDSPGGTFTYKGKLDLPLPYSIDSNIFADDDGKLWMFWGGGSINVMQLAFDGTTLTATGASKQVLTARGVGSSATIEGAWVIKRNGWYYLTYSQGHYNVKDGAPDYRVLVARSKTVNGNYSPNNSMRPIPEGKSPIIFPGHHSIVTDASGGDWMVYHGYFKGEQNTRSLNIDPITYDADGWPVVNGGNGPSSSQQPGSSASGGAVTPVADTAGGVTSKVSVFGDSLTVGMKNKGDFANKLTADGWKVQIIEAQGGENIAWARDRLKKQNVKNAVSNSDVVVVAMGTNADDNPSIQIDGLVSELQAINPSVNIQWVNIYSPKPNKYRANMNTLLDDKSSSLGFSVIDWLNEAKNKIEYYQFSNDDLHHTDEGYQRKSTFVAGSLKSVLGVGVETPPLAAAAVECCETGASQPQATSTALAGNDNKEKIWNYLVGDMGFNDIQAAGIMGNIQQESGFDPKAENPSSGAYGVIQWLGSRKTGLQNFAKEKNLDVSDLSLQLSFMKKELESGYKDQVLTPLKAAKTIKEAADIWLRHFEIPCVGDSAEQCFVAELTETRLPNAEKIFQQYTGTAAPAPGSTGTDGCPTPGGDSDFSVDGMVIYNQEDPRWGSEVFGYKSDGEAATIHTSGCGPTSMATIITALTGKQVTPSDTTKYAKSQNLYEPGVGAKHTLGPVLAENWGLKSKSIAADVDTINTELRNGGMIITSGRGSAPFTSAGHFITIRGVTAEGKWKIADSNGSTGQENSKKDWDPVKILSIANSGNIKVIYK